MSLKCARGIDDDAVQKLQGCELLEDLDLSETRVTGRNFNILSQRLRKLNCSHCPLANEAILGLQHMTQMEDLNVSNTPITGEHFEMLSPNLKRLMAKNCNNLTNDAILGLQNKTQLEELSVGFSIYETSNAITGEYFDQLSKELRVLHCFGCKKFGDSGIKKLRKMMKLEDLNVGGTKVTGKHFDSLSISLKRVSFQQCVNLEDDVVLALKNKDKLEKLDVEATSLVGQHFKDLPSSLREICYDVRNNNFSQTAKKIAEGINRKETLEH